MAHGQHQHPAHRTLCSSTPRDVLATLVATPVSQLDRFLPDRWREQQLKESVQG